MATHSRINQIKSLFWSDKIPAHFLQEAPDTASVLMAAEHLTSLSLLKQAGTDFAIANFNIRDASNLVNSITERVNYSATSFVSFSYVLEIN